MRCRMGFAPASCRPAGRNWASIRWGECTIASLNSRNSTPHPINSRCILPSCRRKLNHSDRLAGWVSAFGHCLGRRLIELSHSLYHSDDILHRSFRLDIVNCVEDEASAWRKDLAALKHLLANLPRRSEGQHMLRVNPSTPEDQALAIF